MIRPSNPQFIKHHPWLAGGAAVVLVCGLCFFVHSCKEDRLISQWTKVIGDNDVEGARRLVREEGIIKGEVTIRGVTLLEASIVNGDDEISRLLIEAEADLHAGAPLVIAAYLGRLDTVKLIMEKGVDVNVRGDGTLPLAAAAGAGSIEVVDFMISQGADVNARSLGGRTALQEAAREGRLETMKLLIAHGAEVNAEDDAGNTPLSDAASWGHPEAVDLLRGAGADRELGK